MSADPLETYGIGRSWSGAGPQWVRPAEQQFGTEPFVLRWSSYLGELEDGRMFCVGCGRILDGFVEDATWWLRPRRLDDGLEQARAIAGQRAKVETIGSELREAAE